VVLDTSRKRPALLVGAVAYSANAVPIWEGIRDYFREGPVPMDFVLFSNYERQVDQLLEGKIDIAWNTNLAWVRTTALTGGSCRALAMRDTDLAFKTVFVARAGSGLGSIESLRGRRIALGSKDSAQAAILPIHFLQRSGLGPEQLTLLRFDSDVGKHGDTGASELDAVQAVMDDRADAAAIGITTWNSLRAGQLAPGALEAFWESPAYCHCNFTALDSQDPEGSEAWTKWLLNMDWDVPEHRRVMELEGLRRWVRPELEGYRSLFEAVNEQGVPLRW
jgi:phosphonate transport system substrate-binding protein